MSQERLGRLFGYAYGKANQKQATDQVGWFHLRPGLFKPRCGAIKIIRECWRSQVEISYRPAAPAILPRRKTGLKINEKKKCLDYSNATKSTYLKEKILFIHRIFPGFTNPLQWNINQYVREATKDALTKTQKNRRTDVVCYNKTQTVLPINVLNLILGSKKDKVWRLNMLRNFKRWLPLCCYRTVATQQLHLSVAKLATLADKT